jgi:parallel beta-helix repeat protein
MTPEKMRFAGPVLIAVVVGAVIWASAGSLTPPAGPPAPTMKTLTQVEPRTPVQTLSGDPNSLYVIDQPGSYYLTDNITAVSGKNGIKITADDVALDLNGFALIGTGGVRGVWASVALSNLTIQNGTVRSWGVRALALGDTDNSRVERLCIEYNNSGLQIRNGCVITGCTLSSNLGIGIDAGSGCVIRDCAASFNSTSYVITVGAGCTIIDCSVSDSLGTGIYASSASKVSGCAVKWNTDHGIHVGYACLVVGNTCSDNSTGIYVSGTKNRIEGNNVCNGTRGIDVDGTNNIIIGNTASGNTTATYEIVPGNSYGPIVNVAGVDDISGTPNADHPWANFEF